MTARAGRPRKGNGRKPVTIHFDQDLLRWVDTQVARRQQSAIGQYSRSDFVRDAVAAHLDTTQEAEIRLLVEALRGIVDEYEQEAGGSVHMHLVPGWLRAQAAIKMMQGKYPTTKEELPETMENHVGIPTSGGEDMQQIHERLREQRQQNGVTQTHIAKTVGRTTQWVSAIEAGKIRIRADEIPMLCRAYGLTLAELYGATPEDNG